MTNKDMNKLLSLLSQFHADYLNEPVDEDAIKVAREFDDVYLYIAKEADSNGRTRENDAG